MAVGGCSLLMGSRWLLVEVSDGWRADLVGPTGVLHSVHGASRDEAVLRAEAYNAYQALHGWGVSVPVQGSA